MKKERFNALRIFITRHKTIVGFLAAVVVYSLLAVFYMGGAITNCTQSLLSFPGDNTAGLIALFSIDNHDPWFGWSDVYSYPYGEMLGQPTHITAQALFIPFWVLAKMFGPICGFNVLGFIGFVSAALVMFGFVRWLLKGRVLVALIAGFAVAFTPYLQIKTGVHISYVFEAFFITALWLFLSYWEKPSWKKSLLLGLNIALFAYIDGYFILMGALLMGGLFIGAAAYDYKKAGFKLKAALVQKLKLLLVALGAVFVFIGPILYVQVTAGAQVSGLLSGLRDNIQREGQVYAARPLEYILPNAYNPILSEPFGAYEERSNHGSNPSENILSLSLVMLALAAYFVARVIMAYRRREPLKVGNLRYAPGFMAIVFSVVLLIAFILSLPPKWGPIIAPSYFLLEAVQLWRVLARLVIVINIALVVLGACGLALLLDRIKGQGRRIAICALVFIVIFIEYLTFIPPRPVSGYEKVPEFYYWLKTQQQYKEIAEYPLYEFAESSFPVYYNTYQRVHGKKRLNGAVSEARPLFARKALRDLTNPQTVPGLRELGIDLVVVHAADFPGEIPGLKLVKQGDESIIKIGGQPSKVWGYAVEPGIQADYVASPVAGFHAPIIKSPIHEIQKMGHRGEIEIRKLLPSGASAAKVLLEVKLESLGKNGQNTTISQDDTTLWQGTVPPDGVVVQIEVNPEKKTIITAVNPATDATLLLPRITVR